MRLLYFYDQCIFYFTVPPVISDIKVILLQQQQQNEDKNKQELILLCETANRHPVEYSWMKNGTPLTTEADMVKVSLQGNNTVPWQYECHVTNLAGTASRSLAINPIGKTGLRFYPPFLT